METDQGQARPRKRALIISDLHLEFYLDREEVFSVLPQDGIDIMICAGDLDDKDHLRPSLERLCGMYPVVIYVAGNHEYWGSSTAQVDYIIFQAAAQIPNLVSLDAKRELNEVFEWEGRRILGGSMWFRSTTEAHLYKKNWVDFDFIKGFSPWVFETNDKTLKYLEENLRAGDIVVTHHLPSERSTPPYFLNSPSQAFFVCDMERLIGNRQPALWVHGHTHGKCDYYLGDTRILCRPMGYPAEGKDNKPFATASVFDI